MPHATTRFADDAGFLMSNLGPEDTGIEGAIILFSGGEFSCTESHHGPRILVTLGRKLTTEGIADSVCVTITGPPNVLGALPDEVATQVVEFAKRNRDLLLWHWNGEIDTADVIQRLERV